MGAAASPIPTPLTSREVLRIPVMRRVWYAQIVSQFGDFLALFAVLSVASFTLKATATQVTWVQIAYLVPLVFLGPIAGVFVDRWPLKPTLVSSDLIRAGLTLLLLAASTLWHFYLILAAISVVSSFFGPAQGVTIRNYVPREGMMAATALMNQVVFVIRIVAPAAAGLLVASFGPVSCYLLDAVSFVGSAMLILSVAIHRPAASTQAESAMATGLRKVWLDMRSGFQFILHHSALLFVILALATAMFTLGCFGPLIAVYVRESLHRSTRVFGITSSMIGVGILVGSFIVQRLARRHSGNRLVLTGLAGIAIGVALLSAIPLLPVTLLAALTIGFAVAAVLLPAQTLMQQETPAELMGRVGSTMMSIIFGAQVLGLVISGVLTQFIGVRQVFLLCAVFLVGLIGVGVVFLKRRSVA